MKVLSKSILIMFCVDFFTFLYSSIFWYQYFKLPSNYIYCAIVLSVFMGISVLFLKGNYQIREFNINIKNTYLLFEGIVLAQIPLAILLFVLAPLFQTLKFILLNILTAFIVLRLYRALFHVYLFNFKQEKNVLIIGADKKAKLIADEIVNKKALKMNVVGFLKDTEQNDELVNDNNFQIFELTQPLKNIIDENNIDIVIVAIRRRMEESFLTNMVQNIPESVKVYSVSEFYEKVTGKCFIDRMSVNLLFYQYMTNRSYVYDFCKRAFDIIAASIILTVTLPILIYIAIRVKLTDGGSPIFTQTRVGKYGKPFKMYKLRTMYVNDYTPQKNGIVHTESQDLDDRVIPFCKFVRKARFDEIPQMINILKGEMSIVGPRTEWEDLVKIYAEEIKYYKCRQWVNAGWTGWAQINQGHCVASDDIAEKLQYDLYYLKHRNVAWEICILVKAIFLAVGGRHG